MTGPLSDEWRATLAERLARVPVGEAGAPRLRLGLRVTASDGSVQSLVVVLGGGEPSALLDDAAASSDVVLVERADTAERLAAGATIADELAAGRVKIEGDIAKLVGADRELAALAAALAGRDAGD